MPRTGITIPRHTLESWAGRALSDQDVTRISDALPHSSVPDAIGTIADSLLTPDQAAEIEQAEEQGRLTRDTAEAVRQIVIDHFYARCHNEDGTLRPECELPRLFEPGHNGTGWDLAWEGYGPYDWTALVTLGGVCEETGQTMTAAEFPPGVRAEPINNVELGLHPRP